MDNMEREIDLRQLIIYILMQWRLLIVAGIVCALLGGAFKAATSRPRVVQTPVKDEQIENYEAQLERIETTYQAQLESYEAQVARNEEAYKIQLENYNEQLRKYEEDEKMKLESYEAQLAKNEEVYKEQLGSYEKQLAKNEEVYKGQLESYEAQLAKNEEVYREQLRSYEAQLAKNEEDYKVQLETYTEQLRKYEEDEKYQLDNYVEQLKKYEDDKKAQLEKYEDEVRLYQDQLVKYRTTKASYEARIQEQINRIEKEEQEQKNDLKMRDSAPTSQDAASFEEQRRDKEEILADMKNELRNLYWTYYDMKEPAKPVRPAMPVRPVMPVTAVKPAKPVKAADPAKPVKAVNPAKPVRAADPAKPVKAADPAKPVKAVNPAVPVRAVKPVNPVKPIKPALPAKPRGLAAKMARLQGGPPPVDRKRAFVKGGAIGIIGGGFAVVMLMALRLIMTGRVLSSGEFFGKYPYKCLTVLPPRPQRKTMRALDRLLLRWADNARYARQSVAERYAVAADGIKAQVKEGALLLLGAVDQARLEEVRTALASSLPELALSTRRFVDQELDTLHDIDRHENIVLVESILGSRYQDVDHEVQALTERGRKVLGCIVVWGEGRVDFLKMG